MGFGNAGRADAQLVGIDPAEIADLREEFSDTVRRVGEPHAETIFKRGEETGSERLGLPRALRRRCCEVFHFEVDFLHRADDERRETSVIDEPRTLKSVFSTNRYRFRVVLV